MLITFEGIDGSGKTTISEMLFKKLKSKVPLTRYYKKSLTDFNDPYIKNQMLRLKEAIWPSDPPAQNGFGDYYWLYLNAAWFSVIQKDILDAENYNGNLIIFDGWYYRLIARFINKGFDKTWLLSLFNNINEPDLVIFLDIDPRLAWKRRTAFKPNEVGNWDGLSNCFESFCMYQEKTRSELIKLAGEKSWLIVKQNESTTPDEMCNSIYEHILSKSISNFT